MNRLVTAVSATVAAEVAMTLAERSALRIVLVTETYPPEINGVAMTLQRWVQGLAERGHEVLLVRPRQAGHDGVGTEAIGGGAILVPGLPLPTYKGLRFGLPARRRLFRAWMRFAPDIVYIATQGPLGQAALNVARRLDIPTVTGFHTNFDHYSKYYGLGLLAPLIQRFLRRFHNRSQATLVPTAALQAQMTANGFRHCRILARGVDTQRFHPQQRCQQLRDAWAAPPEVPVVLYVGRLAPEKNLDLAVRAFRAMRGGCAEARFILVGDGPMRTELQARNPDFVFCGMQVGQALARHYASADLFLFPSLTDTFGNVVIEAMASGLAIVAFNYAAAREHIRHRHDGLLAEFGDDAAFIDLGRALVTDRRLWQRLGQAARRSAEALDWQRVHAQLEAIFLDVVARGPSHEPA